MSIRVVAAAVVAVAVIEELLVLATVRRTVHGRLESTEKLAMRTARRSVPTSGVWPEEAYPVFRNGMSGVSAVVSFEPSSNGLPLGADDVVFRRNGRARRYVARIDRDGNIALTVPRGGTRKAALEFANSHRAWLLEEREKARCALDERKSRRLGPGDSIWFRGERVRLEVTKDWGRPVLLFADQRIFLSDEDTDLARPLKARLRALAKETIPPLVFAEASRLGLQVTKVTVRDQKTRWGSCSTSGTISLNWRLVLAPPEALRYVIAHELTHLKRFDHSPVFWRMLEEACPDYRVHEAWLEERQDELSW